MALFSHIKQTFNFPKPSWSNPYITKNPEKLLESAVISKTNYIKQCPSFYQISLYPANHRTKQKQNQNRKWIEKTLFFTLCHHTVENSFLITLPQALTHPNYQPRHHNTDKFLWHHISSQYLSMKQHMLKPFHLTLPELFSYQLPRNLSLLSKQTSVNEIWYIWL